jgi:intracellular multiplication protein IcmL
VADELEQIIVRNEFYKDGTHRLYVALVISILLNFAGLYALIYVYSNPPSPVYFPTSSSGRITPLIPLDQPNMTDTEILQWANLAIIAANSYNYVNYRSELQAASEFFTADGWNSFIKAIQSSNNLQAVISNKFVVSAMATQAPTIIERGVYNGSYSWRIRMPIMVTYQSQTIASIPVVVNMLITRVSTLNSPKGIGIAQFVSIPVGESGQ